MRPSYGDFILEQERREKRRRNLVIFIVVLVILLIATITGIVYFVNKGYFPSKDAMADAEVEETEQIVYYTQEELDAEVAYASESGKLAGEKAALDELRQILSEGKTAVEAFRAVYTDSLVVASGGQYHFIPINDALKKNDYTTDNLSITETGEYQYTLNGEVVSYKGIDVSKFQEKIDWKKVAEDGVQFAFIRVGNRGYGTGTIVEDNSFKRNIKGATDSGIKVGVYFFSQAITEAEAIEEANYVLGKIAPYQVECPVVIDVEMISGDEGRMDALTAEERTKVTKAFCETIQNAGYKPMIYMNLEMAAVGLNLEELDAYEKWFAYYNPEMYFPYEYSVWQYSEKGTVQGINGSVDLNISFKPIWE